MITYDKYYQTPRIWLIGYDEVGFLCRSSDCPLNTLEYRTDPL